MKLEKTFKALQVKNPYWSSFICFANSIKGKSIDKIKLSKYFNKYVEKDDYARKDKESLLKFAYKLTDDKKT